MKPTRKEYLAAQKIVEAYDNEILKKQLKRSDLRDLANLNQRLWNERRHLVEKYEFLKACKGINTRPVLLGIHQMKSHIRYLAKTLLFNCAYKDHKPKLPR